MQKQWRLNFTIQAISGTCEFSKYSNFWNDQNSQSQTVQNIELSKTNKISIEQCMHKLSKID